jgi:hypothetical protein
VLLDLCCWFCTFEKILAALIGLGLENLHTSLPGAASLCFESPGRFALDPVSIDTYSNEMFTTKLKNSQPSIGCDRRMVLQHISAPEGNVSAESSHTMSQQVLRTPFRGPRKEKSDESQAGNNYNSQCGPLTASRRLNSASVNRDKPKNVGFAPVRKRASRACDECNKRKTKCDSTTSCARCIGRRSPNLYLEENLNEFGTEQGIKCEYKREPKRKIKAHRNCFVPQFVEADKVEIPVLLNRESLEISSVQETSSHDQGQENGGTLSQRSISSSDPAMFGGSSVNNVHVVSFFGSGGNVHEMNLSRPEAHQLQIREAAAGTDLDICGSLQHIGQWRWDTNSVGVSDTFQTSHISHVQPDVMILRNSESGLNLPYTPASLQGQHGYIDGFGLGSLADKSAYWIHETGNPFAWSSSAIKDGHILLNGMDGLRYSNCGWEAGRG